MHAGLNVLSVYIVTVSLLVHFLQASNVFTKKNDVSEQKAELTALRLRMQSRRQRLPSTTGLLRKISGLNLHMNKQHGCSFNQWS